MKPKEPKKAEGYMASDGGFFPGLTGEAIMKAERHELTLALASTVNAHTGCTREEAECVVSTLLREYEVKVK